MLQHQVQILSFLTAKLISQPYYLPAPDSQERTGAWLTPLPSRETGGITSIPGLWSSLWMLDAEGGSRTWPRGRGLLRSLVPNRSGGS